MISKIRRAPQCATAAIFALVLASGCDENGEKKSQPTGDGMAAPQSPMNSATMSAIGPGASAVPIDMSKGWCAGHGVPESVCARCNSSLVAKFKKERDWCKEHDLPESQCTNCNPTVREQWAALNPANATNPTGVGDPHSGTAKKNGKPPLGPASSPVKPTLDQGWCGGHGVPESVCTRCGASPEKFKEAGDWCKEHGLPESQCVLCRPEVEAEWAKLDPANQKDDRSGDASGGKSDTQAPIRLEWPSLQGGASRRLLTGSNDSQCQVDRLRVRFLDKTTARKAGIETEVVQARRLSNTIECPAEVGFNQTRLVRITPRVSGVVTETSVEIGSLVKTDDLLAVMESPSLGQAKSRYIRCAKDIVSP